MLLRHLGLTCSSEKNSDKFYKDLLGLEKSKPKTLPAALCRAIFNLDDALQIINYTGENVHFEIFIHTLIGHSAGRIEHACLEVGDLESFLQKCRAMDLELLQIPKRNKILTFIKDFDGNLFEIKES
jgi:catechol 2,3-dioxygenase-like lactoylglutathione lyase family enzyme